ncbi:MAG: hypothetical protein E7K72_24090, partial [Roseomonas mucosa]|nr:hypothetical protein [Roseomonas mucosa]
HVCLPLQLNHRHAGQGCHRIRRQPLLRDLFKVRLQSAVWHLYAHDSGHDAGTAGTGSGARHSLKLFLTLRVVENQ